MRDRAFDENRAAMIEIRNILTQPQLDSIAERRHATALRVDIDLLATRDVLVYFGANSVESVKISSICEKAKNEIAKARTKVELECVNDIVRNLPQEQGRILTQLLANVWDVEEPR